MRHLLRLFVPCAFALAIVSIAPRASAVDLVTGIGAGAQLSNWRSDVNAVGAFKLGFRFLDVFGPYAMARIGYGSVDNRMMTHLSLGLQLWLKFGSLAVSGAPGDPTYVVTPRFRPYARIAFVHQHEETMASVDQDKAGALLGIGEGIRHRGGIDGAIGADIAFKRTGKLVWYGTVEGIFTGFPDSKGPVFYGGLLGGVGVSYTL